MKWSFARLSVLLAVGCGSSHPASLQPTSSQSSRATGPIAPAVLAPPPAATSVAPLATSTKRDEIAAVHTRLMDERVQGFVRLGSFQMRHATAEGARTDRSPPATSPGRPYAVESDEGDVIVVRELKDDPCLERGRSLLATLELPLFVRRVDLMPVARRDGKQVYDDGTGWAYAEGAPLLPTGKGIGFMFGNQATVVVPAADVALSHSRRGAVAPLPLQGAVPSGYHLDGDITLGGRVLAVVDARYPVSTDECSGHMCKLQTACAQAVVEAANASPANIGTGVGMSGSEPGARIKAGVRITYRDGRSAGTVPAKGVVFTTQRPGYRSDLVELSEGTRTCFAVHEFDDVVCFETRDIERLKANDPALRWWLLPSESH